MRRWMAVCSLLALSAPAVGSANNCPPKGCPPPPRQAAPPPRAVVQQPRPPVGPPAGYRPAPQGNQGQRPPPPPPDQRRTNVRPPSPTYPPNPGRPNLPGGGPGGHPGRPAPIGTAHHLVRSPSATFHVGNRIYAKVVVGRYRYPRGHAYRRYEVGGVFPRDYWISDYYIYDYADYGLDPPAYNYQWMRYGPDLVLVDLSSGEIAQVVYGAFDESSDADQPPPDGPPGPLDEALQALNQGDVKSAIHLFSLAIGSGGLSNQDLEYAYVQRGGAYLQRNEPDHARRDADQALRLAPEEPGAVALWNNTTIDVQPTTPEKPSRSRVVFTCQLANPPNARFQMILEIDFENYTVISPNFGERGRKLETSINPDTVSWSEHLELNGGRYTDMSMVLDRSTGLLTNQLDGPAGSHLIRYVCRAGG